MNLLYYTRHLQKMYDQTAIHAAYTSFCVTNNLLIRNCPIFPHFIHIFLVSPASITYLWCWPASLGRLFLTQWSFCSTTGKFSTTCHCCFLLTANYLVQLQQWTNFHAFQVYHSIQLFAMQLSVFFVLLRFRCLNAETFCIRFSCLIEFDRVLLLNGP